MLKGVAANLIKAIMEEGPCSKNFFNIKRFDQSPAQRECTKKLPTRSSEDHKINIACSKACYCPVKKGILRRHSSVNAKKGSKKNVNYADSPSRSSALTLAQTPPLE